MTGLNPPKLLVILTLPMLSACSHDNGGSASKSNPFAGTVDRVHLPQVMDGIGKYVGRGYRGWEFYADPRSCTLPLFDLGDPSVIDVQDAPGYEGRYVSGDSKSTFFNKLSGDVSVSGTYEGFSGEITTTFSKEVLKNRHNSFASSQNTHTYYSLTLLDKAPLLPDVKTDFDSMEPEKLFEKYGTHYLRGIYLGARVSYSSHVDRSAISEKFNLKATMRASYLDIVEGKASGEHIDKQDLEQITTNREIKVVGGDPALGKDIEEGIGKSSDKYNTWAQSIEKHMSIADFDAGGLRPIYELVDDEQRRAQLASAWETFMASRTDDTLTEEDPPVVSKNSEFILVHKDGRYFGEAPYDALYGYYYPKMSGNTPVKLKFAGDKSALREDNNVEIKTTEEFPDSFWTGKWSERIKLGAFGDKHNIYYWIEYGGKTNWIIEKNVPSFEDRRIRFGDEVRIRNDAYSDQYLVPSGNNFLTTATALKNSNNVWTIEEAPE